MLTRSVISHWGLNLSNLHKGLNPQAESSCGSEGGWCQTAPEQVISRRFLMPMVPWKRVLFALPWPLSYGTIRKTQCFWSQMWVRMSQWDVTPSICPAPHLIQITGVRNSLNKTNLSSPVLAHGQATSTQIFLKIDKIVLSMSRKVQLLCAAGGWHQVSPASLCGTVWRHKDRQRWWEGTLLHLTLVTLCTLSVWAPSLTVVSKVFISLSKEDVKYTGK